MIDELKNLIAKRKAKIIACNYSKQHFNYYDTGVFYHSLDEVKAAMEQGKVTEKSYNHIKNYYENEIDLEIKKLEHEIEIIEKWEKEIEND